MTSFEWRVRSGPRNTPTQKNRENHETPHVSFRDWDSFCMMDRGCTKSSRRQEEKWRFSQEDSSLKWVVTSWKWILLRASRRWRKNQLFARGRKKTEIRISWTTSYWRRGVQELRVTDRVTKFIDLLDYREITLKSDTESAIIAFRDRVVEVRRAEVMTEDAVKWSQESTDSLETSWYYYEISSDPLDVTSKAVGSNLSALNQ